MNKLQSLKCVEVTSQRQADNGTICYHDPIAQCDYLSYESGYIRRSYKSKSYYSNKIFETIYQLNLLAAQLAVVPTFAFKPIFGILTLPLRLLTGAGAKVMEKLFGALGATKISRGIANWIGRNCNWL